MQNDSVGRFILNDTEEVSCDDCIFTIHPKEVLKILPEKCLSKAFVARVSEFEESVGFFSVYGAVCNEGTEYDEDPTIFSIFPHGDLNKLLDPEYKDDNALVIMKSVEEIKGKILLNDKCI